ncbi:MAG: hypothetical protein JO199_04055, partial [Candidatus Eremiobacteraeota bacterium]|nr:hypothetical protein [Candidatus Eremiobacteraeota bacterium]
MQNVHRLACLSAFVLLAACGQALPAPPAIHAEETNVARRRTHDGIALFRIKVPRRHQHERYVSPATQSMTLSLAGPTVVNQTIPLTPGSANCKATISGTLCSFSPSLAPGQYTATIATFDAVNPQNGKELSEATGAAFTITAGTTNAVNLTLSGVPASLAVAPESTASTLDATGKFDLIGTGAHPFLVEALDSDGNTIVGPGAPAFSVTQTGGSMAATIVAPTAKAPNQFSIAPPAAFTSNTAAVKVQAQYSAPEPDACTVNGAACSATFDFAMEALVATAGNGAANIFTAGNSASLVGISNSVNYPSAIAFDRSGDLFVASCLAGCGIGNSPDAVLEYSPPYTQPPAVISNGVAGPEALEFDAQGRLYVANCGSCSLGAADSIAVYDPPLNAKSVPAITLTSGVKDPRSMTLDAA